MSWETPVETATVRATSSAPTATGAGASVGATCAGAVMEVAGSPARRAAALGVTPSAVSAELVDAARAWLEADDERWTAMLRGPFGPHKREASYWRLVDAVHTMWTAYSEALRAANLTPPDRRKFALELTGGAV